jgi:hypothetical protein
LSGFLIRNLDARDLLVTLLTIVDVMVTQKSFPKATVVDQASFPFLPLLGISNQFHPLMLGCASQVCLFPRL